jgi:lysozyme
VYRCTSGVLTIGWGRALEDPGTGITEKEAELLLENDLVRFEAMTRDVLRDTWHVLDQVRREALIEMCFNMGPGNLAKFKMMIASLAEEDFEAAADEALSSRWADQVGKRADRIAERIRSGEYA